MDEKREYPYEFTKKYILEEKDKLGSGSHGNVYKITQRTDGTEFAAKVCKNPIYIPLYQREYEMLSKVSDSKDNCVIKVYDVYEEGSEYIIVLEYIGGYDLFDFPTKNTRLREQDLPAYIKLCVKYVKQVFDCIEYLHSKRVVHRDIKPENIMLMNGIARIIDFGLADNMDEKNLDIVGTVQYQSPDLLRGKISPDILEYGDYWALCITLAVILYRYYPFEKPKDALKKKLIRHFITYNPLIRSPIDRILQDIFSNPPLDIFGIRSKLEEIFELYL